MIIHRMINLEQLSKEGKSYKWENENCNKCSHIMWGHGFTSRYFQSFSDPLYMKRYRCPNCKAIVTTRPLGYWQLVRTEAEKVFDTLHYRLTHYVFPPVWPIGISRQRGGYWLRKFSHFFKMNFSSSKNILQSLSDLKSNLQSFFT
jgi:hypothetical protein